MPLRQQKIGDQLFRAELTKYFTNSSRKGLLYVQVVYKYFVILQVHLSVFISVLMPLFSNINSNILDSSF
jgi:hypothetical protein